MYDAIYQFLCVAGLESVPTNLAALVPYLGRCFVAVACVLGVFSLVKGIGSVLVNWRLYR